MVELDPERAQEAARRDLEDAVLRGKGKTSSSLREAVAARASGAGVPEDLRELVEKMERQPYRVTDEDIAKLKAKYGEDELFEIIVSSALGASIRRLNAGLRALSEVP